jgi:hypothetical protein
MLIDAFNHTIDIWIAALEKYSMEDILVKPGENNWSIGQVYMHLPLRYKNTLRCASKRIKRKEENHLR